jgi:cell division transport system ATP-binding protein
MLIKRPVALVPTRSILQLILLGFVVVALPLVIAGLTRREIDKRARAALDQVGLLDKERQPPRSLSAGEQQRVGIARAVVTRPRLLIADEPPGNLDADLSLEIMQLFRRFNEVGVTMLIATHDLALAARINGRHVVLHQGQVTRDQAQLAPEPGAQGARA